MLGGGEGRGGSVQVAALCALGSGLRVCLHALHVQQAPSHTHTPPPPAPAVPPTNPPSELTEEVILNPPKIDIKLKPENVDIAYPPLFQSGGHFDLKLNAQADDNALHAGGCVWVGVFFLGGVLTRG